MTYRFPLSILIKDRLKLSILPDLFSISVFRTEKKSIHQNLSEFLSNRFVFRVESIRQSEHRV